MQIAIDISQVGYEGTGVARFTAGLIEAICTLETKQYWTFFYSSLRRPLPQHIRTMIERRSYALITAPIPPRALATLWNTAHLVSVESFVGSQDWFISSDWTQPPARAKKATIVHDLVFRVHPETVNGLIRHTQEQRLARVARDCNLIITDSLTTKTDLEAYYAVSPADVVVNYPGLTQHRKPTDISKPSRPFILTVGKREPRKNIDSLVQAFLRTGRSDIDLFIVGMQGWGTETTSLPDNVKMLGYVSDDELAKLYASCLCFVFPSLYEGFGYPALEAMALGAPTALSDTSSLREIGKGVSQFFDPMNLDSITRALTRLIDDSKLRLRLSTSGTRRAAEFTWKRYLSNLTAELEKRI